MSWKKFLVLGIAGVLAVFAAPGVPQALTIDVQFYNITNNNSVDVADQLLLRIMDPGDALTNYSLSLDDNQVLFAFTNDVGIASSISEIYIDDGTIVGQSSIQNNLTGYTYFTGPGANPGNLPGGETLDPDFVATQMFSADAVGNPARGVDSSLDTLGIVYNLYAGLDIYDVQAALNSGDLRIGLHLRGIGEDGKGSDSFVNHVPDASIMFLLGPGLIALGIIGRKKRR